MLPQESVKIDINVPATMRDGTVLRADVYRPDNDERHPTLVSRIPYDKSNPGIGFQLNPIRMARNGYAVVIQDCRGTMASEGKFIPLKEAGDGYDTVEWAAVQPWSNGKVGMYGPSYLGMTQWYAAIKQPPHLVAMFPLMAYGDMHDTDVYYGGAFPLQAIINWCVVVNGLIEAARIPPGPEMQQAMGRLIYATDHIEDLYNFLPLKELPVLKETRLASYYFDWLDHPDKDDFWRDLSYALYDKVTIPVYHLTCWYDLALYGTLENFQRMQNEGGSEAARENQKLIIGPWFHSANLINIVGELDMGLMSAQSLIDLVGIQIKWFDYWLKGVDNGIASEPPVRIFVMGDNVWRTENEWPLERTQYTKYYLHSNGRANSSKGDGALSTEELGDELPDTYEYDPKNPVPTKGGCTLGKLSLPSFAGAHDQSAIELRNDVLVYTTPPLEADLEVTGPLKVKLFASSSATDTDFTAKLVDVWPDGRAYNLADGIIRARYRESLEEQVLIEPDKVYEYTINLWATSKVFKAGHCIRVEIGSSNFPRFDRNPNTGHPFGQDAELNSAIQRVFHDSRRPSHITLPVIPR